MNNKLLETMSLVTASVSESQHSFGTTFLRSATVAGLSFALTLDDFVKLRKSFHPSVAFGSRPRAEYCNDIEVTFKLSGAFMTSIADTIISSDVLEPVLLHFNIDKADTSIIVHPLGTFK